MDWSWLWFWRRRPSSVVSPAIHPVVEPIVPLICPACQQERAVLRMFADGARLCLSCLEKR